MSFINLPPEVFHRIATYLLPPEATNVFSAEFGDDHANVWEFDGREFPVRDNLLTLRDVRSMSGTSSTQSEELTKHSIMREDAKGLVRFAWVQYSSHQRRYVVGRSETNPVSAHF